jgi:hypothetical protein
MRRWSLALGALALVAGVGRTQSVTGVMPASHDFGRVVVAGMASGMIGVAFSTSTMWDSLETSFVGPDANDFSISRRSSPAAIGQQLTSSCVLKLLRVPTGTCAYEIDFRPSSPGKKTATLEIRDLFGRGTLHKVALTGEGIFGCLPVLVPCNYAQWYSGDYTTRSVDSTLAGLSRRGRWAMTVDIKVERGVAWCSVSQDDYEEDGTAAMLIRRSTTKGVVNGPGLFAIEFSGSGSAMEYTLKFACPSPAITTNSIDYMSGETSTGRIPAEPADWRRFALAADPQPATQLGMVDLVGKQSDINNTPANDVGGHVAIVWALKRVW